MERRTFLAAMPFAAASAAVSAAAAAAGNRKSGIPAVHGKKLRFRADGRFRILAITDLHFRPERDPYAIALIEEMIAREKPDLVLANGDNIMGRDSKTRADVERTTAQVAEAMEKLAVPWAVTLGNHDRENLSACGLSDEAYLSQYEVWPHNCNRGWERDVTGTGNKSLLIWDAAGTRPLSNLWLLDSGKGVPDKSLRYEWVRQDQIDWYMQTSVALEKRYGKLPALMFFHIPVREFLALGKDGPFLGERREDEGPSAVNSGLFAAVLERGDVMGIFCGHDHMNNYLGSRRGVALGFVGVTGILHAYPHVPENDPSNARMRGGRIFELHADEPGRFETWIRLRDGSVNWKCRNADIPV